MIAKFINEDLEDIIKGPTEEESEEEAQRRYGMSAKQYEEENHYKQVCVWPGTVVGEENIEDFEKFFLDKMGTRVKYIEEIKTNPDPGMPDTGGRNDVFFSVHKNDVGKFAVTRLSMRIRWIDDVYGNDQGYLYPERVKKYKK